MLGMQATRFHRAAERKVLGRNVLEDTGLEPDEEIADPNKMFDATNKLSTLLIGREAVVPVAAAALIPFAVAGATRLPYKEVLSVFEEAAAALSSMPAIHCVRHVSCTIRADHF